MDIFGNNAKVQDSATVLIYTPFHAMSSIRNASCVIIYIFIYHRKLILISVFMLVCLYVSTRSPLSKQGWHTLIHWRILHVKVVFVILISVYFCITHMKTYYAGYQISDPYILQGLVFFCIICNINVFVVLTLRFTCHGKAVCNRSILDQCNANATRTVYGVTLSQPYCFFIQMSCADSGQISTNWSKMQMLIKN